MAERRWLVARAPAHSSCNRLNIFSRSANCGHQPGQVLEECCALENGSRSDLDLYERLQCPIKQQRGMVPLLVLGDMVRFYHNGNRLLKHLRQPSGGD